VRVQRALPGRKHRDTARNFVQTRWLGVTFAAGTCRGYSGTGSCAGAETEGAIAGNAFVLSWAVSAWACWDADAGKTALLAFPAGGVVGGLDCHFDWGITLGHWL
jgi:hypothetical protein